jgi:hypothetical protein
MGIEPTTNSLEGCDSTTELLPPDYQRSAYSVQRSETRCNRDRMTERWMQPLQFSGQNYNNYCRCSDSKRARILAVTTRRAKSPRISSGSHRICTPNPPKAMLPKEYSRTGRTALPSMVNQASSPNAARTPNAIHILLRSAAGFCEPVLTEAAFTLKPSIEQPGAQGRIRTSVAPKSGRFTVCCH